jgi:hypothetical protein
MYRVIIDSATYDSCREAVDHAFDLAACGEAVSQSLNIAAWVV